MAYLRSHPQELLGGPRHYIALAKTRLAESVAAVRLGARQKAVDLALSAYLDGFEPVESLLASQSKRLFERTEAGLMTYRTTLRMKSLTDVEASEQALQALLDESESVLVASGNDAVASFVGALTILLREGVEALLIIVAMLAFLKKAERDDVLRYVHAGWLVALAFGALSWFAAAYLVTVSGASRELTEGFSSLFAAAVLLSVGVWMHQKSMAGQWQDYLKRRMSAALNRRTAWLLFGLAFVAVYREVFETVLFLTALWTSGNGTSVVAGLGIGGVILCLLAVVLLRTSAKLPINRVFSVGSFLIALLVVVLTGKGVTGLQEAGLVQTTRAPMPRIDLLGIYPSMQSLGAQLAALLLVVVGFVLNLRSSKVKNA